MNWDFEHHDLLGSDYALNVEYHGYTKAGLSCLFRVIYIFTLLKAVLVLRLYLTVQPQSDRR